MGNYIFSLSPTFTQGLLLGQLSILFLLALILKFLFLQVDDRPAQPFDPSAYSVPDTTRSEQEPSVKRPKQTIFDDIYHENGRESAEWFNLLVRQVVQTYRSKLRNDLPGPEGDEIARLRIERFANSIRPPAFVDPVTILSVDLGSSAPRLSNARVASSETANAGSALEAEFDTVYTDHISVSLSTSVLFNYPLPYFVRLPVTLTISLSLFSSTVVLTPPDPASANPTLTISLPPNFTLDLKTTSLIGSRAKLADVPKLHELIQAQIRRVLAQRATWKVVLPYVANVDKVKEEVARG